MIDSGFSISKQSILRDIETCNDISPKGTIDRPILELVNFINHETEDYVTTSSCSGRISVFEDERATKGVSWFLVRHGCVTGEHVREAVENGEVINKATLPGEFTSGLNRNYQDSNIISLKCEPFILHIRCRDLTSGQHLHAIAISCGYRESGLVIGSKSQGKIMVAIRTNAFTMEVPIARRDYADSESKVHWIVDSAYLDMIVKLCNAKLMANFARISRFLFALKKGVRFPVFSVLDDQRHDQRPSSIISRDNNNDTDHGKERKGVCVSGDRVDTTCRRWGHVTVKVPLWGYLIFGGYGCHPTDSQSSRRGLPTLFYNHVCQPTSSHGRLTVARVSSTPENGSADVIEPGVHAAAVQTLLDVPFDGANTPETEETARVAVIFGGRHGPSKCLPVVQVYRVEIQCPELGKPTLQSKARGSINVDADRNSGEKRIDSINSQDRQKEPRKRRPPTKGQLLRMRQRQSMEAVAELSSCPDTSVEHVGECPCPRWGHSVVLLASSPSSGEYWILLHGGRDDRQVFSDCYIARLHLSAQLSERNKDVLGEAGMATSQREVLIQIQCHWRRVESREGSQHNQQRFFHVCCRLQGDYFHANTGASDDSEGSNGENDPILVLVHGGLGSLEGTQVSSVGVLDLTDTLQVFRDSLHQSEGFKKDNDHCIYNCRWAPVMVRAPKLRKMEGHFAHSILAIGAGTYLLMGGSTVSTNESASETLDDEYHDGNCDVQVMHLIQESEPDYPANGLRWVFEIESDHFDINVHDFGATSDSVAPNRLSYVPDDSQIDRRDLRCHHQVLLLSGRDIYGSDNEALDADVKNKAKAGKVIHEVGGGVHVLAFGQEFAHTRSFQILSGSGGEGKPTKGARRGYKDHTKRGAFSNFQQHPPVSNYRSGDTIKPFTFSDNVFSQKDKRQMNSVDEESRHDKATKTTAKTTATTTARSEIETGNHNVKAASQARPVDGNELDYLVDKRLGYGIDNDSHQPIYGAYEHALWILVPSARAKDVKSCLEKLGGFAGGSFKGKSKQKKPLVPGRKVISLDQAMKSIEDEGGEVESSWGSSNGLLHQLGDLEQWCKEALTDFIEKPDTLSNDTDLYKPDEQGVAPALSPGLETLFHEKSSALRVPVMRTSMESHDDSNSIMKQWWPPLWRKQGAQQGTTLRDINSVSRGTMSLCALVWVGNDEKSLFNRIRDREREDQLVIERKQEKKRVQGESVRSKKQGISHGGGMKDWMLIPVTFEAAFQILGLCQAKHHDGMLGARTINSDTSSITTDIPNDIGVSAALKKSATLRELVSVLIHEAGCKEFTKDHFLDLATAVRMPYMTIVQFFPSSIGNGGASTSPLKHAGMGSALSVGQTAEAKAVALLMNIAAEEAPKESQDGTNDNNHNSSGNSIHGVTMLTHNRRDATGGIPSKFEIVGDVLMLPQGSLSQPLWQKALTQSNLTQLAACFGKSITRVARRATIDSGPMRESHVELLLPKVDCESYAHSPMNGQVNFPGDAGWASLDLSSPQAMIMFASSERMLADLHYDKSRGKGREAPSEERIQEYLQDYYCVPKHNPGWVRITENGVVFGFDLTRVMFCTGNVTERMRMGGCQMTLKNESKESENAGKVPGRRSLTMTIGGPNGQRHKKTKSHTEATSVKTPGNNTFPFAIANLRSCPGSEILIPTEGQIVVDCYCGVGYYTIPLLLHARVRHVHALEWNPHSVLCLRHNLKANRIDPSKYTIHHGDNRYTLAPTVQSSGVVKSPTDRSLGVNQNPLWGIADRVLLGLLPSSEEGWALAARLINKKSGGIIHVHQNVNEAEIDDWAIFIAGEMERLVSIEMGMKGEESNSMRVEVVHVERVKSYAPRVIHIVVDLLCYIDE